MTGFDLAQQPCVPVTEQGKRREVSVREALLRAYKFGGLAMDDPLQAVAIFRQLLLPIYLDATGAPRDEKDWATRWQQDDLDGDAIDAYLSEHADQFDLFHPTRPFAQVAGLHTANDDTKPISLLLAPVATGNNVPLFTARTEADPPALSLAEAARALLAAHCWDTAAIKSGAVGDGKVKAGKTTGNPTSPVGRLGVILPMGTTLAQTLLLNTPIMRQGLNPVDRPWWRAEPLGPAWLSRPALGPLDLLTWQARRVRLVRDNQDQTVRAVVLAAGDRLDQTPEFEPHTAWKRVDKPKAGEPANRPVRHQPGRAAWRGLASLLATREPTSTNVYSSLLLSQIADLCEGGYLADNFALQVLTVGVVYGNQQAVVEDVIVDTLPLPIAALPSKSDTRALLLQVASHAEDLRVAANQLGDELRRAVAADAIPWDKGQRLGDALVHEFNPIVRRLLFGLQREPVWIERAEEAWCATAYRLALEAVEPALNSAAPQAFLGRPASATWTNRLSTAELRYRSQVRDILGIPLTPQSDHAIPGAHT